ncbi:MAG: hypothetical protein GY809_00890, partial [Planctomycetes bacterium]|nr:hypothetical protein [Planctomycetota bacterium]
DVAAGWALLLNDLPDFAATSDGEALVVIRTTGSGDILPTLDFAAADAATELLYSVDGSTAVSITVNLDGIPAPGEIWTIELDSASYGYVVGLNDSLADVATALASAINAADSGLVAYASGDTLLVVKPSGTFTSAPTFDIEQAETQLGATAVVEGDGTRTIILVAPTGGIKADTDWSVVLNVDGAVSLHTYRVTDTTTTLNDIALALAADINANADFQFEATVDDTNHAAIKLVIEHTGGAQFTLVNSADVNESTQSTIVALSHEPASGSPVLATPVVGEVWTVILDKGETRSTMSHVVASDETLADVALALADLINTQADSDFLATTDGIDVLIVSRTGVAFTTFVEVTAVGTVSILDTTRQQQPEANNNYFYGPVNLNFRVDETEQVDVMNIYHGSSPSDDIGVLTEDSLTGLGMGGDTVIAGRELPGGIVYYGLEVLNIDLGTGNDTFTIESTHHGVTNLRSGRGDDQVTVETISGHTTISTEDGADTISVQNADQLVDPINGLLTVSGGGDQTDTLSQIAEALAYLINTDLDAVAAGYSATVDGDQLTILNSSAFTAALGIVAAGGAGTFGGATVNP